MLPGICMEYNHVIRVYCTSPHKEPKLLLLKIRKLSLDWQKTVQRKWLGGGGDVRERMKGTVFILSKLEPGCLCSNLVLALCWGDWIMGTWESISLRSLNSALNIPNSFCKCFLFAAISAHFWIYIVIKGQRPLMLITPSSFFVASILPKAVSSSCCLQVTCLHRIVTSCGLFLFFFHLLRQHIFTVHLFHAGHWAGCVRCN